LRWRAGDDRAFDQIFLRVTARFYAGRAGPECSAAREEVFDQRGERIERRHVGHVDRSLADEVDARARQEHRHLEAGGDASVGDGERRGQQLMLGPMRDDDDKVSVGMVLSFFFGGTSRFHCKDRHALDTPLRSGVLA
jgi:hypothetical protein